MCTHNDSKDIPKFDGKEHIASSCLVHNWTDNKLQQQSTTTVMGQHRTLLCNFKVVLYTAVLPIPCSTRWGLWTLLQRSEAGLLIGAKGESLNGAQLSAYSYNAQPDVLDLQVEISSFYLTRILPTPSVQRFLRQLTMHFFCLSSKPGSLSIL